MSASHQREAAIFDAAMELPPERRSGYLDEACGEDAALRRRVESLLKADESSCEFLDSPTDPSAVGPTTALPSSFEKAGDRIGRYKLLQQIGEGGCGVVYMAEQEEPVSRRVALKVIKLGLDTKSVIARFEAERQALALMDHPNIAKVFDAGATETGRPYFVMELVRGLKITEYCDEARLSTNARLDLFLQVCQAIQHAHQKGIIHRDIKPSNILVTINDGVPVPKVIDFGVAKATGGLKLTNKTLFTAFEQFIGTPAYMSPEQAVLTSLDIDTRSDIYALGVLLYEMLTGRTPFDAKELLAIGLDEMRRTIREQEPPRPSTRLSTLAQNELCTTAQRRGIEAPKLVSELRGDLDWIVMKALEKDRARRYETANGLAADIQRHLHNEPVVACPPSRLYRLQKTVRRNKLAFSAAAAVVAALSIGLGISTWRFIKEREALKRVVAAEQTAKDERDSAEAVLQFVRDRILAAGRPEGEEGGLGINVTLHQAIDSAETNITQTFHDRPLVEAAIRLTLGEGYYYLGEPALAISQSERALALRREGLGFEHPHTIEAMGHLALAYLNAGKIDQAIPLQEETLKLEKAKLGPDHSETLTSMNNLAQAYWKAGKRDQAFALMEVTLKLRKAKSGPEHRETLTCMNNLAMAYAEAGKRDQAILLWEETLKLTKAKFGPEHPWTLTWMYNLGEAYHRSGKLDKAIPLLEEAFSLSKAKLGPEHPRTRTIMNNLGLAYRNSGKLDKAIPLLEEAVKLSKATKGPEDPGTLTSTHNLGLAFWDAGQRDKALPLHGQVFELRKAKLGSQHTSTLDCMRTLAVAYRDSGQLDHALPLFQELLKLNTAVRGPNDPETRNTTEGLVKTLRKAGKLEQAEAMFREQLAQKTGAVVTAKFELGRLLLENAKTNSDSRRGQELASEGERLVSEYLAGVRSHYTNDPLKLAERLYDIAELRYRQGSYAEADSLYREIVQCRRAVLQADHKDVLDAIASLARLLSEWAWAERNSKSEIRNPKSEMAERSLEAERLLREVLVVRLRDSASSWRTGDVKSRLGAALVSVAVTDSNMDAEGRGAKLVEAESLLVNGCERVQSAATDEKYKRDALQRLVRLYEAWNKPDKCAEWQQKLELFDKAQNESSGSNPLTEDSPNARTESK